MTWVLATLAVLLIGYATISRRLESLNVSGAMYFTTTGLLAGPVLGLIDFDVDGEAVKLLAEITLTLVLFADASRISLRALRGEYTVPLRLLGIGLPLTILAGALAGAALLPGSASPKRSCSRSCSRAPTPRSARRSSPTSASPPGSAKASTSKAASTTGSACRCSSSRSPSPRPTRQATPPPQLVFEQIGYGLIGGVIAGALGALALRLRHPPAADRTALAADPHRRLRATRRRHRHRASAAASSSPPSPAASCSARCDATQGGHVNRLVDEGGEVFNAVTFIIFGALILGPTLDEITWQIALYALLSLTVVRMLPVALSLIGTGARRQTLAFLGWFGPRGLASVVFAVILIDDTHLPHLAHPAARDHHHDRALRLRPRPHRQTTHRTLRPLVQLTPARRATHDGKRARTRRTASASPHEPLT